MIYVKTDSQNNILVYPYNLDMFRKENSNVSLPSELTSEFLETYLIFKVHPTKAPEVSKEKKIIPVKPVFENGVWFQSWNVVDKTQQEIEQEYIQRSRNIRERRNRLLLETDWVVAKAFETNTPIPQVWIDYRQVLRDVSNQENFPYEVIFPDIPS
jgi:hypothetical protein